MIELGQAVFALRLAFPWFQKSDLIADKIAEDSTGLVSNSIELVFDHFFVETGDSGASLLQSLRIVLEVQREQLLVDSKTEIAKVFALSVHQCPDIAWDARILHVVQAL